MPNFILDNTSLPSAKVDGAVDATGKLTAAEFNIVRQALLDVQTVMRLGILDSTPESEPGGRLTLTSATPVTTADVSGAGTVYFTPDKHSKVSIYTGLQWQRYAFTELSNVLANSATGKAGPAAAIAGAVYDLFVWDDAGTLRLTRGPAWASDTNRGTGAGTTELERVGGVLMNKQAITNGPAAQRGLYVGSIATNAGAATVDDTKSTRHVWNMYNRKRRDLQKVDATDSWSYSTAIPREANGATNRVLVLRGLDEDTVRLSLSASCLNSTATVRTVGSYIGLDATGVLAADCIGANGFVSSTAEVTMQAHYSGSPGLGKHALIWVESGGGTDTQTWYGDRGSPSSRRSGLLGECMA